MVRYWKGAHTRHRLQYHLVWIPKYRKRVLIGKVSESTIRKYIEEQQV